MVKCINCAFFGRCPIADEQIKQCSNYISNRLNREQIEEAIRFKKMVKEMLEDD